MTGSGHGQHVDTQYRAYGHILSCRGPLHELRQTGVPGASESADLHILFSSPDEHIPVPAIWYLTVSLADGTPWLRCAKIDSGYLIHFPNLAGFIFSPSDNSIRCIPHHQIPEIPAHTLHHLLLDQVLPLVLNYRGKEVLHGAAVMTPHGACAFVGPTGSGKSTLAASFLAAGYSVITDDCIVLDTCGTDILIIPSYPGLRLWDDAIAALFEAQGSYAPVTHYNPKQRFTSDAFLAAFCSSPAPLAGIYVLGIDETDPAASVSTIEHPLLTQRDALMTLLSLAFKLDIEDHDRLTREFDFLYRLVTQVPVRRLHIPNSFDALPGIHADILDDLAKSCC